MAGPGRLSEARARLLEPWVRDVPLLTEVPGPVLVACSGGADSVALLALAATVRSDVVAVHVDHGLRPGGADEAAFVAAVADRMGVPSERRVTIVAPGPNLEARARAARHAALAEARESLGAATVALGHTADDQAETVVLNLLRGSGSAGLGAMTARRGHVVRPLLGLRRTDTEAVCAAIGVEWFRDPTNDDVNLRRNWVRHEVLPALSAGAARDLVPVLARQAALLRSESDYLDELARAAWPPDAAITPAAPLVALPEVLARRAVRQWVGGPPPSAAEVDRILAVARGQVRATQLAGGRRVSRSGGVLVLTRASVTP